MNVVFSVITSSASVRIKSDDSSSRGGSSCYCRLLHIIAILLFIIQLSTKVIAQNSPELSDHRLYVDYPGIMKLLSSDSLGGREAGTSGASGAALYIASEMQNHGLEPAGNPLSQASIAGKDLSGSWFQVFEAISYKKSRDSLTLLPNHGAAVQEKLPLHFASKEYIQANSSHETDTILLFNILGLLRGTDTSNCIIVGAHYDHLGTRFGQIYPGSDDNASGVAGMLAIAGKWAETNVKPECNVIFAAWAGEEKGLMGSSCFAQNYNGAYGKIKLYFNIDMISGNAPGDKKHRQLSVGTLPESGNLRKIAKNANKNLPHRFRLDLWDVTGRTGSDYASFIPEGVPVMTFFSGYTGYYHTPGDTFEKADLQKMTLILKLIEQCALSAAANACSGGVAAGASQQFNTPVR